MRSTREAVSIHLAVCELRKLRVPYLPIPHPPFNSLLNACVGLRLPACKLEASANVVVLQVLREDVASVLLSDTPCVIKVRDDVRVVVVAILIIGKNGVVVRILNRVSNRLNTSAITCASPC